LSRVESVESVESRHSFADAPTSRYEVCENGSRPLCIRHRRKATIAVISIKIGEISPTISPVLRPELLGTGVEDAVAVEKGAVVVGVT
jgi:hypothetical protein